MNLFRKLPVFVLLCVAGYLSAQTPKFSTAVEYNDYIVEQQLEVGRQINAFNGAMGNPELGLEEVKVYHLALLNRARLSALNVGRMQDYQGNTRLRNAARALYEFYAAMIDNEYRTMMEIALDPEPNEEDIEKMNAILVDVSAREKVLDEEYLAAQEEFAKIYGFSLKPTDFEIEGAEDDE